MIKKIFITILSFILVLSMVACNNQEKDNLEENSTTIEDSIVDSVMGFIGDIISETESSEESSTTINSSENNETIVNFIETNQTLYAKSRVNVRSGPSIKDEMIGYLNLGDAITCIGFGSNGWNKVLYKGQEAYISANYLVEERPEKNTDITSYPLTYSDSTCVITIYKEWYEKAWCYAAHLQFSDYDRFSTDCANGSYNNGTETTSQAANRLGAIFAVNGCYSAPYLNRIVVRNGNLYNGSGRELWIPAIYSSENGKLLNAWEEGGVEEIVGKNIDELVEEKLVTDTFNFGFPILINGEVTSKSHYTRSQRTFIGTNGKAGDIWIVVSNGRYNDGESAGLNYQEMAQYLADKECKFVIPLDGGGSSTMYFNGKILNTINGNQRSVVDFVYFK